MPFVTHNDVNIYYEVEGKGAPIIFISGRGSKNSWFFQVPFFKDRMMTIIYHNRGTGKSSRPNYLYSMEMMVEDLKALIEHLNAHKKINLCGLSMGGSIAQNFVLKYPELVNTVILIGTAAYFGDSNKDIDKDSVSDAFEIMENLTLEQRYKVLTATNYGKPFRRRLKKDKELFKILLKRYSEMPTTLQDYKNQGAMKHDTRELLHKIKHPTLIITGDDDKLIGGTHKSEFLHKKIPNSRLEIIKDAGHSCNTGESEKVNNFIWEFIKEHPK